MILYNTPYMMNGIDDVLQDVGRPIVVATHPRSGTHLTLDLLRKQFKACKAQLGFGETLHHLYVDLDRLSTTHPHPMSLEEAADLLRRAPRPTIKTHSLPSLPEHAGPRRELAAALIEKGDVLYVVRDGRDVLCSTHVWKKEDEPELADYSLSEFLRLEKRGRSRVGYWAEHVQEWAGRRDVQVVRFEDILDTPRQIIERLGRELDLDPLYEEPYLPEKVQGGRWSFYWRRLVRNFESTAIAGRPNGQEPADWEEDVSEKDRRFFQKEAGDVLSSLGYTQDDSCANTLDGQE
jgi:hypothetical protein